MPAAIDDALARQNDVERCERALEEARASRDEAVWRASQEGLTPPAISRALDGRVSVSRVRQVIALYDARASR